MRVCFESFSADWNLVRSKKTYYNRYKPTIRIYDRHTPYFYGDNHVVKSRIHRTSEQASNPLELLQNPSMLRF